MDISRTARPLDPRRRAPTVLALFLLAALPASCGAERAPTSDSESALGEVAQAVVTLPPDHAWGLDEVSGTTALDTGTPGGVNAALGAKATRVTPGKVGAGAVSLSGASGSVINFGTTAGKVLGGDFTATFWMRTSQAPASSFELLGNRGCAGPCNFWGLRSGANSVTFEMYQDGAGTNSAVVTVQAKVTDGTWHFIAARRSATEVTLVVDDQSKSQPITAPANIVTSTSLTFGENPIAATFGTRYIGEVDEVRLHYRALEDYELLPGTVMPPPSDSCHAPGICDVTTGVCTDPVKADGTACDDGDPCTGGDTCQLGVCAGTALTCAASDACHLPGTCSPAAGGCTNPEAPNGTFCDDGDLCTQTDTCLTGVCTGSNPKTCAAGDACHYAGVCLHKTGECVILPRPDSTPCDDGDACTTSDVCKSGACAGAAVECAALDECHEAGTCDPQSGMCQSSPIKPEGTPCAGGVCTNGVCSPNGAGGSDATSSTSASTGTGGGPGDGSEGGCGCRAAGTSNTGPGAFLFAAGLALRALRRRRAR